MRRFTQLLWGTVAIPLILAAQQPANPIASDSPSQVGYASNLNLADSIINITNTGSLGASLYGPGFGAPTGNICVNVYGLDPGEELISCCSCLVTPDGLASLSVNKDILSNTLTAFEPTSVVIKLIATPAGGTGTGTSCSQSAAFPPVQPNPNTPTLEPSLAAWRTTVHTTAFGAPAVTETPFTPATLSSGEISSLTNRCKFIIGNGSGSGICNSCRTGAFGALKLNLK